LHAMQDAEHDLSSWGDGVRTYDGALALRSVIEGDASFLEELCMAALWGLQPDLVDVEHRFLGTVPRAEEYYEDFSIVFTSFRYVPYTYGAYHAYQRYQHGGLDALKQLFEEPPVGTLELLGIGDGQRPAHMAFAALAPLPAPEGYELSFQDSLGPWLFTHFDGARSEAGAGSPALEHWVSDRLLVYWNGARSALAWEWLLDEQPAAQALARRLDGFGGGFAVHEDRRVVLGMLGGVTASSAWKQLVQARLAAEFREVGVLDGGATDHAGERGKVDAGAMTAGGELSDAAVPSTHAEDVAMRDAASADAGVRDAATRASVAPDAGMRVEAELPPSAMERLWRSELTRPLPLLPSLREPFGPAARQ